MAQTALRPALAYLDGVTPLPVAAEIALRVAVVLAKWSERRRSRRALSRLDDHLLHDIGLDRHAARAEARRHFWLG